MKPHVVVVIVGMFLTPIAAVVTLYWPELGAIVSGSLATAVASTAAYLSSQGE